MGSRLKWGGPVKAFYILVGLRYIGGPACTLNRQKQGQPCSDSAQLSTRYRYVVAFTAQVTTIDR